MTGRFVSLWCGVYLIYVTYAPISNQIFAYDVQPYTVQKRRLFIDLAGEKGLGGPDSVRGQQCLEATAVYARVGCDIKNV